MKFILDNKDFDSVKADAPKPDCSFEIRKIGKDDYALFYHTRDNVFECWTFTKFELRIIWEMMSEIPFNTEIPKEKRESKLSHEFILDGVCSFYEIDRNNLRTYRRNKKLVERRMITIRLLHLYTDRTLKQIAELVGYKNHATVFHHLKQADLLLSKEFYGNDEIKRTYKQLLNHLKL